MEGPYIGAGRIVKILLGTSVISEGIDLFNIRQVHILEPHWNFVRIDQTIGRARRVCSHVNLPAELWTFTAWIYLATVPSNLASITSDTKMSTDELIYTIAERKKKINDVFLGTLKSAAVDCGLNASHNKDIKCMVLPPPTENNIHAYHPDLSVDVDETRERFVVTGFKKIGLKLDLYPTKIFHPNQFPELWTSPAHTASSTSSSSSSKGYTQKYLIEVNDDGNMKIAMEKGVKKIYLYDREAFESQKKIIDVGYLLIRPPTKPLVVLHSSS